MFNIVAITLCTSFIALVSKIKYLIIGAASEQRPVLVDADHPYPLPMSCECLNTVPAVTHVTGYSICVGR